VTDGSARSATVQADALAGADKTDSVDEAPVPKLPVQEVPAQRTPVDAAPTDAEPVDADRADAEPVDVEPADAAPVDEEPAAAGPIKDVPVDAAPVNIVSVDALRAVAPEPVRTGRGPGRVAVALVQSLRPRQWVKNILVAAAPLAAGSLWELSVLRDTLIAFAVFVAASAGAYLVNDARDAERDRAHPTKRRRPIARGDLPVPLAYAAAVVLLASAVVVPALTGYRELAICVGLYVVFTLLYSNWLKHEPILDLALVAAGFLLRSMAGGLAADIPLSRWFLIVAAFGSLFMVAGKRYSEMVTLGEDTATRPSLQEYSASYLRFVWSTSAGVVIAAYCLWAFEVADTTAGETTAPWASLSIAPLVLGVLKYARDVDRGHGGEPEEIVLRDKGLLALGAAWLLLFGLGVLHA
jgi:decaprenyl-phosphate phosphoribosyltransferase